MPRTGMISRRTETSAVTDNDVSGDHSLTRSTSVKRQVCPYDHSQLSNIFANGTLHRRLLRTGLSGPRKRDGPKGRNFVIKPRQRSKSNKDGVIVANTVVLKHQFGNLGPRPRRRWKDNEIAGDGTTTATVLTRAILSVGVKNVAVGCKPSPPLRKDQRASGNPHLARSRRSIPPSVVDHREARRRGSLCILSKLRGQLRVTCKVPGFGDNRKSILGDLAILKGGTVFTNELDIKLGQATVDLLGSFTVTREDTIFLNGAGSKDAITARCEQIRSIMHDPSTGEYDKTKLQEPLAKLSGGVAVTQSRKKDRYDDALNATPAAVEEGILPGGGFALLKASLSLKALEDSAENFDQKLGVSIIRQALKRPVRQIVDNTGAEGSVVVGQLLGRNSFGWGYDGAKGEFSNTVEKGIVDPYKVVKTALVDSSGVASLLTRPKSALSKHQKTSQHQRG
ncbi:chaperonin [Tulasnella sp. 427]|nr:chaperonin [Tulasnella sp. 427]